MNKIIQINLAGQALSIDEKAYDILRDYLRSLEKHFRNTESGDEIMADIEARMSELFLTKIKGNQSFISEQDVKDAIELMGSISDMEIDDTEEQSRSSESTGSSQTQNRSKKLFRDPDDKIVGGVCAGIAAYLNVDTSIVRLVTLALILFGGVTLVPYIILWILIPEAKTSQDRYRMHGKTPDINDIVDNVRNEANKVADNIKKNSRLNRGVQGVSNGVEQIIRLFAKILGALALSVLVIVAISLTFALIASATGHSTVTWNGDTFIAPQFFDSPLLAWLFSLSLLLVILTPILTIIYILVQFIMNSTAGVNLKVVFLGWLVALALFIGISIYASGHLNVDQIHEFRYQLEQTNTV